MTTTISSKSRTRHNHFMTKHARILRNRTLRKERIHNVITTIINETKPALVICTIITIICLYVTLYETGYFNM